ncbi:MAG: carbohydrate kinase, partial [Bowdeniella nasicola]|nr:carbohydrate kinase [Bowdeniella nasicola]
MRDTPVLVVGEALIDEIVDGETIERHPGGSPANVAIGLARLETNVALLSHWGRDSDAEVLTDHFTTARVAIVPGSQQAGKTSTARAVLDSRGAATYEFTIRWDPETTVDLSGYRHLHTGSLGAVLAPGAATVAHIARSLAPTATISVDPNARAQLLGKTRTPHPPAWDQLVEVLHHADVVKASDEDLAYYCPGQSEAEFAARCFASGSHLVVITAGAHGVRGYLPTAEVHLPPFRVPVVDTVGAGDAFMAGLLAGLDQLGMLGNRHALQSLDGAELSKLLRFANATAALTVSRAGANPPTSS